MSRAATCSHLALWALLSLGASRFEPAWAGALECPDWQARHPEWLWCDDFESDADLAKNYFDLNRADGRFGVSSETAFGGHGALKATYSPTAEDAGGIKLSLGRTPVAPLRYTDRNFDELYWRFYMKTGAGWVGQPRKVTRATIFVNEKWAQAAVGHLWEDSPGGAGLGLDPVSGVQGDRVVTTKWNDFANFRWLGKANGPLQLYAPENREHWFCVEVRMKLNTPGTADGVFAFWIDGRLEAQKTQLDWRGSYTAYGINAITLENWVNGGAPRTQARYFDNFVVSTRPIGCQG
jgi:hypothetical protein